MRKLQGMKIVSKVMKPLAIGGAFGAVTSLVNWVSTPADAGGNSIGTTIWGPTTRVASKILDSGWAWAALAVAVGWLAGTAAWGAISGTLALLAATAAYDLMDSVLHQGGGDMNYWGIASALLGPILGAVGAGIRRPGVVGFIASLTVPAGAALQMIVLPPGGNLPAQFQRPEALWARAIVLGAALLVAGLIVIRFARERTKRRRAVSPRPG